MSFLITYVLSCRDLAVQRGDTRVSLNSVEGSKKSAGSFVVAVTGATIILHSDGYERSFALPVECAKT